MIQVHCLEIRIAVLDRPYWVYYRTCVLETFTIPLRPLEDLQELENFVSHWLRLQQYVENLACQLQNLERESNMLAQRNFFRPREDSSEMNTDNLLTPSTPTPSSIMYYDIGKP